MAPTQCHQFGDCRTFLSFISRTGLALHSSCVASAKLDAGRLHSCSALTMQTAWGHIYQTALVNRVELPSTLALYLSRTQYCVLVLCCLFIKFGPISFPFVWERISVQHCCLSTMSAALYFAQYRLKKFVIRTLNLDNSDISRLEAGYH